MTTYPSSSLSLSLVPETIYSYFSSDSEGDCILCGARRSKQRKTEKPAKVSKIRHSSTTLACDRLRDCIFFFGKFVTNSSGDVSVIDRMKIETNLSELGQLLLVANSAHAQLEHARYSIDDGRKPKCNLTIQDVEQSPGECNTPTKFKSPFDLPKLSKEHQLSAKDVSSQLVDVAFLTYKLALHYGSDITDTMAIYKEKLREFQS